jgi:hypothetical protein
MVGILEESQRRYSEAFLGAVDFLGERLDQFETKTLAPVLTRSFTDAIAKHIAPSLNQASSALAELSARVVDRQEYGMREMAEAFSDKLTELTSDSLTGLDQLARTVSGSLSAVAQRIEKVLKIMEKYDEFQETARLEARNALTEAGRIQLEVSAALAASLESVHKAEAVAAEMREYAVKGLDKADAMALQSLKLLEGNITQVKALQNGITELSYTLQRHMDNSIARVSAELNTAWKNMPASLPGRKPPENSKGKSWTPKWGSWSAVWWKPTNAPSAG